jgi:transposase
MDAKERYELIRPILDNQKTVHQVHQDSGISDRTLRRYLKRFREGGQQIESLADKSSAAHSHPKWFTTEQKELVVEYKLQNPPMSARQIAKDLETQGILRINNHSVSNILKAHELTQPFFSTQKLN